jgi:hypothetical protein
MEVYGDDVVDAHERARHADLGVRIEPLAVTGRHDREVIARRLDTGPLVVVVAVEPLLRKRVVPRALLGGVSEQDVAGHL